MQNIPSKVINYMNSRQGVLTFYSKKKRFLIPLIFIISYVLLYFLIDFSSQSLVAHDEGLYARRARLIEESNNWFAPPFSSPHHKTLGSYWLIALSIRLFGSSELSLRLPSILASFLCLFISYLIAIKLTNKKSALISVFSLSSMPLWIQYSRFASPDIPFVFCILLVILFFLEFLDSNQYISKCIYIFISGLFISLSFFIRSYMVFVPLIGLAPFISFHLFKTKKIFITFFFSGILIGLIPTFLSLYFSYQSFGMKAISSLFAFAKKQAIGAFEFGDLLLIPFNYLYLTFPVGILLVCFFAFTRSNKNIKYPLFIYLYPFISLLILLCMSTSYPHYYLFLLPSLSFLFTVQLESNTFRTTLSLKSFKYLLVLLILAVIFILFSVFLYFKEHLIDFPNSQSVVIYTVYFLLIFSYILSLRSVFKSRNNSFNLFRVFYSLIIPQIFSISLLYNFGVIGSPNIKVKSFINRTEISTIINSNTIYLYNVDSKIQTLLSYYLPSSKILKSFDNIHNYDYIITSNRKFIDGFGLDNEFKSIYNFDNHVLLLNIGKK